MMLISFTFLAISAVNCLSNFGISLHETIICLKEEIENSVNPNLTYDHVFVMKVAEKAKSIGLKYHDVLEAIDNDFIMSKLIDSQYIVPDYPKWLDMKISLVSLSPLQIMIDFTNQKRATTLLNKLNGLGLDFHSSFDFQKQLENYLQYAHATVMQFKFVPDTVFVKATVDLLNDPSINSAFFHYRYDKDNKGLFTFNHNIIDSFLEIISSLKSLIEQNEWKDFLQLTHCAQKVDDQIRTMLISKLLMEKEVETKTIYQCLKNLYRSGYRPDSYFSPQLSIDTLLRIHDQDLHLNSKWMDRHSLWKANIRRVRTEKEPEREEFFQVKNISESQEDSFSISVSEESFHDSDSYIFESTPESRLFRRVQKSPDDPKYEKFYRKKLSKILGDEKISQDRLICKADDKLKLILNLIQRFRLLLSQ